MIYRFNKDKLTFERITVKVLLTTFGLLGIVCLIMSIVTVTKINDVQFINGETKTIIVNEFHTFTKDKLKAYIVELNLKYPHIVLAQAELESAHFKSPIFMENHNFFGMKCAKLRPTTNKGENRGHAYFDTWRDCVVDYAFYQARYLSQVKSEAEYLAYLKQNYAQDTLYVPKLLELIEKNTQ
jgi:hypothetical protein